MLPNKLRQKLVDRRANNSLRTLGETNDLIDFSSNDYLGFSTSVKIFQRAAELLREHKLEVNGAGGSRLLSGNHTLYSVTESVVASFHVAEAALIFNSGYDANIGFFGSVPQRRDLILYDELCHASIRDGIVMSLAKAHKFKHNDLVAIEKQLSVRAESRTKNEEIYVVTESIFSMDGDQPDLETMIALCKKYGCHLIVDEAHAVGVMGCGHGLVQELGLAEQVFARIVTFGKALGCHGAAVLGSNELKQYLTNFSRSFIYTTALSPHTLATIKAAYERLQMERDWAESSVKKLYRNIAILQSGVLFNDLIEHFIPSASAIHSCIIPENDRVKRISLLLKEKGFDLKPILSPTVQVGQERLRICLHSFNTAQEIQQLLQLIATFVR